MNHKLLSSLTASLLIATLGVQPLSNAKPISSSEQGSEPTVEPTGSELNLSDASTQADPSSSDRVKPDASSGGVVKVGEQQAQASAEVIAKVQPHQVSGREAATLYVRNIPILTFLGVKKINSTTGIKVGTQAESLSIPSDKTKSLAQPASSLTSLFRSSQTLTLPESDELDLEGLDAPSVQADPVWRASLIAARLNQLQRAGVAADRIGVNVDQQQPGGRDRYVITADKIAIAIIDSDTLLPDTTRNLEKDALQATNRLRRVLGNAAPLREVTGKPASRNGQEISFGPIRMKLTGFASWYGPGFHGNPSASGERFNQHAMTAAHRTLPFGTQVVVTNLDNGQSVVVRINDRGPFHGNRIIDLSTAAARVLGLVQSGIAPVRLDVVDTRSATVRN